MNKELKDLFKETENKLTKAANGGYCMCCPLQETCNKSYNNGGLTICAMLRFAQDDLNKEN